MMRAPLWRSPLSGFGVTGEPPRRSLPFAEASRLSRCPSLDSLNSTCLPVLRFMSLISRAVPTSQVTVSGATLPATPAPKSSKKRAAVEPEKASKKQKTEPVPEPAAKKVKKEKAPEPPAKKEKKEKKKEVKKEEPKKEVKKVRSIYKQSDVLCGTEDKLVTHSEFPTLA